MIQLPWSVAAVLVLKLDRAGERVRIDSSESPADVGAAGCVYTPTRACVGRRVYTEGCARINAHTMRTPKKSMRTVDARMCAS